MERHSEQKGLGTQGRKEGLDMYRKAGVGIFLHGRVMVREVGNQARTID